MRSFQFNTPASLISLVTKATLGVGSLLFAGQVFAAVEDALTASVGETYSYDDNLFLLPSTSKQEAEKLLGKNSTGDRILQTAGELKFKQKYSLQKFDLDAKVTSYRYSNFDFLNFTAKEYSGAWLWSLTPHWSGNVSLDRTQLPQNYAEYRNFSQQNVRTTENRSFGLDGLLFGPWHLLAGVGTNSIQNSALFSEQSDYKQNFVEAGLKYLAESGAFISVLERSVNGDYSNRTADVASLLDTSFDEKQHELKANLPISGHSTLKLKATAFERKHKHFNQRDYSGVNSRLDYIWYASEKLQISLGGGKRYNSYQDIASSYYVSDDMQFDLLYWLTPKMSVAADLEKDKRDFRGAVQAATHHDETISIASLTWNWQLARSFALGATIRKDKRTASLADFEYISNSRMLNATLQF